MIDIYHNLLVTLTLALCILEKKPFRREDANKTSQRGERGRKILSLSLQTCTQRKKEKVSVHKEEGLYVYSGKGGVDREDNTICHVLPI